jgi:hypothetical protein
MSDRSCATLSATVGGRTTGIAAGRLVRAGAARWRGRPPWTSAHGSARPPAMRTRSCCGRRGEARTDGPPAPSVAPRHTEPGAGATPLRDDDPDPAAGQNRHHSAFFRCSLRFLDFLNGFSEWLIFGLHAAFEKRIQGSAVLLAVYFTNSSPLFSIFSRMACWIESVTIA